MPFLPIRPHGLAATHDEVHTVQDVAHPVVGVDAAGI